MALFKLDDNEKGAFHYLLGGLVVMLVLRLLAFGADIALAPADEELKTLAPFRHGYYLADPMTIAITEADRSERIAWAVVVAALLSVVVGSLVALVQHLRGQRKGPAARMAARITFVPVLAWGLWTALCMPLATARIADRSVVIERYSAIVGDIPLPFTARSLVIPSDSVERISAEALPHHNGCDSRILLVLHRVEDEPLPLSGTLGSCPLKVERLLRASMAAARLERDLH